MHVIARRVGMPDMAAGDQGSMAEAQGRTLASYVYRNNARKPALGS